jgi:hypothetical protein
MPLPSPGHNQLGIRIQLLLMNGIRSAVNLYLSFNDLSSDLGNNLDELPALPDRRTAEWTCLDRGMQTISISMYISISMLLLHSYSYGSHCLPQAWVFWTQTPTEIFAKER